MSELYQVKQKIDNFLNSWENFKHLNDRRLKEIEKKGSSDSLTDISLKNLNDQIDNQRSKINYLETCITKNSMNNGIAKKSIYAGYPNDYSIAMREYLRKGNTSLLEKKSLSTLVDADGGYLVGPEMSDTIEEIVAKISSIRQVANVQTISSDSIEILQDNEDMEAGWSLSETSIVPDTNTAKLGKKVIQTHELYAQPKATQKLIDDSLINIEEWVAKKIGDIFAIKENEAFVIGDGINKPKGILTYPNGSTINEIEQINSGINGSLSADAIIILYYTLKDKYAVNASFVMNRSTIQQVRLLKDSNGQYLWTPGIEQGSKDLLMGIPIIENSQMPIASTGSLSIAVGDFASGYTIADRIGTRIIRDPYTEKPFVKFYATKRVGGDVVNGEAIKLLKLSS